MAKDEGTGAVLAYDCFAKGPSENWVVKQFVRDLDHCGRRDVRLQTNGEPAVLALQQAIAEGRKGETVQRNSLAYNSQSNGGAEKAVQEVTDLLRRMRLGLEAKVRSRLDLTLPCSRWLSGTQRSCSRDIKWGTTG